MRAMDRYMKHPKYETVPGYWQRHEAALLSPRGPERPIANMLRAWLQYAETHRERYDSGIGEDYVLGPAWEAIGRSLRTLLNGECGRLDCGAIDAILNDQLKAEGFEEE